jgi:hypothetical protein
MRLVPDNLSHETIECTGQLHEFSRRGEVLGVAFVAIIKGRRFIRNAAGECIRDPSRTRGLVAYLDDFLRDIRT